jgi:DNA-binding protein
MILDTTGSGPLGLAIRHAIRAKGDEVREAGVGEPSDLFMAALDCRAIVCTAAPNLLDGKLDPSPSPERMKTIVRAANAPGVRLVVLVVPSCDHYAEEELILKKDGIPYVILRCAPLVEELAEAMNFHVTGSLWLARGKTTAISTCADVATAVRKALIEDSLQGATIDVPSEQVDLTEAVRRAARVAGAHTEVRATSPSLIAAFRKVSVWLGRPQPPAITLYERMLSTAA